MRHVILARDRRRKKNRLKGLLFFMALVSILIGIGLALKNEDTRLPVNQPKVAEFEDHRLLDNDNDTLTDIDILGTDENANILTTEPTYIDIEITEEETEEEDINATSYDDDLNEEDDVENALSEEDIKTPIVGEVTKNSAEIIENINTEIENFRQAEEEKRAQEKAAKEEEEKKKALKPRHYSYTVTRGDKLQDVLDQSGINSAFSKALTQKFPQLVTLQTGQQFQWGIDADGNLEYMNWLVSEKEEQRFTRKAKNQFTVKKIEKKGVWKQDVVKGTINGDFVSSLKSVGLSQRQIQQLANGLHWQIATHRLKKGDRFAILVKREYINGKVTELGNVEALHVISGKKSYYAIQADNGQYYSRHGETLGKGFARYPFQFTPRISSSFNPNRIHPISKRLRPHKGVDFAVAIGTPIIAPADGVVEHIGYQAKGAGKYIKIRHGGQYVTVYMHLSQQLVSNGQRVKKGERIALSGNTGGSTGPHLHYEFHINGNPVNPVTVKLPGSSSGMSDNERKAFLAKAKNIEAKLKL